MDKRLTAAGYAILPLYGNGPAALPTCLCVILNGEELPGSRHTLATPAIPGPDDSGYLAKNAFLTAEREAFDDAEQFAWEHLNRTVLAPESAARRVAAMVTISPGVVAAGLPVPAPAGWAPFPAELTAPATGEPGTPAVAAYERKIAALAQEVERLVEDVFPRLTAGYHLNAPERTEAWIHRETARALLRRLGLALAAGLLASGLWAAPAPAGPQAPARASRHVTRPLSSVTVKIMPHAAFQSRFRASRAAWAITTADADSCTAWVDAATPGLEAAGQAAYGGCRAAIGQAQAKGGAK